MDCRRRGTGSSCTHTNFIVISSSFIHSSVIRGLASTCLLPMGHKSFRANIEIITFFLFIGTNRLGRTEMQIHLQTNLNRISSPILREFTCLKPWPKRSTLKSFLTKGQKNNRRHSISSFEALLIFDEGCPKRDLLLRS